MFKPSTIQDLENLKNTRFYHHPTNKLYKHNLAGGVIRADDSENFSHPIWLTENSKDWTKIENFDQEEFNKIADNDTAIREEIFIGWTIEDVLSRGSELELETELTKTEAIDVLHSLDQSHDANIGISWDTIDSCIQDIVNERTDESI